ncbi:ribosome maturation factor RimM [Oecophyllibacter saccharovorans]|uniref:Ribosome maturation factor RimM n=1 Tax=Oecophyllibacter saccharovorans TaxID=2558360 RepID=A0A506UR56_9PROT|nr:ribosome maturation factor RimM [Oecophyllibacter saccharovorans]TPW35837.1 16S rRNA processing protein RimM [Oecophyllibacter saccharovorans]
MVQSAADDNRPDILIATIGKPHGVRGLVRLYPATESPETVEKIGPLHDLDGQQWRIRWQGQGIAQLIRVDGSPLTDRSEAEKLVNRKLYAAREALPAPEEDSFYHADLLGMEAVTPEGKALGRVVLVHDYGAGTSLELGSGEIVPFTHACVPAIDVAHRRLTVCLPGSVDVKGDLAGEVEVRS